MEIREVLTQDQITKARIWWGEHKSHVWNITREIETTYPPTDLEDRNNPALWKPEHWGWFIHNGSLGTYYDF